MTKSCGKDSAPRSRSRVGALAHLGVFALVYITSFGAREAWAQDPPDTLQVITDSLLVDSLEAVLVSDSASADTIYYNLPRFEGRVPDGWETGVWSWDRSAIMASSANTLAELVAEVPGVIVLLGGDYGTPAAISAFGSGGGGVRILRDGFELFPVDGGVTDLARVGLGGIERVRLERALGELLIEMWSHEFDDGRPYSLIEAGTGELETNLFRGSYADPTALGGSLGLALERVDTQGPGRKESGNRVGSWIRYQIHRGDDAGLAVDFRRMSTKTAVTNFASSVTRTDWAARFRVRLADNLTAEAYTGNSSHGVEDTRDPYVLEGGSRAQHGLRFGYGRRGLWGRAEYRLFGGDLPNDRFDFQAGLDLENLGGLAGSMARSSWSEATAVSQQVRVWTRPYLGFSFFGSWESGAHGSRTLPIMDGVPESNSAAPEEGLVTPVDRPDPFGITDRTATRFGARFAWRDATISAARLRVESDSLIPLGIEPDRGSPLLSGVINEGWELWGSLPAVLAGLRLEGSVQQWQKDAPYLPKRNYKAALIYQRSFLESGNLELWGTLGVRGHDPMTVHVLKRGSEAEDHSLETVPVYENWYGRIQVRVVTVRIFVAWENITVNRNLQMFPGRVLPALRSVYGIRWSLWN